MPEFPPVIFFRIIPLATLVTASPRLFLAALVSSLLSAPARLLPPVRSRPSAPVCLLPPVRSRQSGRVLTIRSARRVWSVRSAHPVRVRPGLPVRPSPPVRPGPPARPDPPIRPAQLVRSARPVRSAIPLRLSGNISQSALPVGFSENHSARTFLRDPLRPPGPHRPVKGSCNLSALPVYSNSLYISHFSYIWKPMIFSKLLMTHNFVTTTNLIFIFGIFRRMKDINGKNFKMKYPTNIKFFLCI